MLKSTEISMLIHSIKAANNTENPKWKERIQDYIELIKLCDVLGSHIKSERDYDIAELSVSHPEFVFAYLKYFNSNRYNKGSL